ncbi:MAG: hypothetical protein ACRDOC_01490 [Streptosporangiaceae bacterium]
MTYLGFDLREWYRRAPLRREWKARAVTFRTELDWVRYQPDSEMKRMEIFVRGDMFRVGAPFGLIPGLNAYFRAPETTIAVSRSPLRIYGIEGRREWIMVRSKQGDREVQLSLTKRFFLDEVWNALVAAGAIPRSDGPARRDRLLP